MYSAPVPVAMVRCGMMREVRGQPLEEESQRFQEPEVMIQKWAMEHLNITLLESLLFCNTDNSSLFISCGNCDYYH